MDLWILSQAKDQLVKTNVIKYSCFKDRTTNKELHIITNNDYDFGIYETKERALEILDEIQKLLTNDLLLFKNIDISKELGDYIKPSKAICISDTTNKSQVEVLHHNCMVFEMPKE